MTVTSARLDRLLAALLAVAGATGLLTLAAGAADAQWLFVVHGVIGASLVAAIAVKLWRSVPRAVAGGQWRRLSLAFLVTGKSKRDVLQQARRGDLTLPAARVHPSGRLHWFADRAAAPG